MATRPVYSTRFLIGQTNTALGTSISYTVPAGVVAVIRTVTMVKQAAATAANGQLTITPSGGAPEYTVWYASLTSTTLIQAATLECRIVANAGDLIKCQRSGVTSDVYWSVSGYLLSSA